jgi:outer membrane protein OmpA-like peptidoglycan-associated protein
VATALGGGIDLKIAKGVAWRVLEADYLLTKFNDGKNNLQNNFRAATGVVFRFGEGAPPPPPNHPPVVSLVANPTKVIAGSGDPIALQATASDPDGDPLTYAWSASGGKVEGTGPEARWNSTGVAVGTYTVVTKVDDGHGGTASASTDVQVEPRPNRPPTINCAADPKTIEAGKSATITATASDPDNDPLTYSYAPSGGKISGTGASVQFDSTGLAPGTYTVICRADDGRGGTAESKADVNVQKPAEQVQLETKLSLHSIYFPTAQPTVKNPTGGLLASQQRTMVLLAGDFKKYLTYKPDAHLILQGHADPRGGTEYNQLLSERRVARTKAFLVEQGVAAGAIETQGHGEEEMSVEQVKQAINEDQSLTPAQKKQLEKNVKVLALAGARRVDVTLSTTGQTSTRTYPFNAEDALNLINPKSTGTGATKKPAGTGAKPAPKAKPAAPAAKPATKAAKKATK